MIVDAMVLLIVSVPLVIPVAKAFDIDRTLSGVVLIRSVMIVLSTPPGGEPPFITSDVSCVPLDKVIREILPIAGVMIVVLVLVTLFPNLVLFVPCLSGG